MSRKLQEETKHSNEEMGEADDAMPDTNALDAALDAQDAETQRAAASANFATAFAKVKSDADTKGFKVKMPKAPKKATKPPKASPVMGHEQDVLDQETRQLDTIEKDLKQVKTNEAADKAEVSQLWKDLN